MASLSDHIDRFNKNTRSIKSTASQIATTTQQHSASPGTFTRAVLSTHLGDLIRDIDPSELGLFRLVDGDGLTSQDHELKRAEFSCATPLRKHPSRRDELQPEVYAHAALRYIDQ